MGFDPNKNIGQVLKNHYERILHPFDMFQKTKLDNIKTEENGTVDSKVLVKQEIKAEKRSYDMIESEEEDVKKVCSEDSKVIVKKEIIEMEGNDYTPHGILSR